MAAMEQSNHDLSSDFIVSDRDGIVENCHLVHAAVVDTTGNLLYFLGNPSRLTLIRSAAKPMQAVAVIEAGALEEFGFDEADLALMCGSHSSEARHVERAKTMLARLQADEDDLQCGGHPPISPLVMRTWLRDGFKPSPASSACSGNHIGVMAAAKISGAGIADYHSLDHPIQKQIRLIMQDIAGLGTKGIKWALDSCNMYSPAMSLQSLASAYAAFAKAADNVAHDRVQTFPHAEAMARIYSAMVRHPENVAGEGRFCSVLGEAYNGGLFGKGGGDGCYAVAVRSSEDTERLGAVGGIGIALKIEDGNYGIMDAAVAEILEQLEIGTREVRQRLEVFHQGKVKNSRGVVTGGLSFPFKLRENLIAR
ncbi:thermolabile L-asparaginase [Xylaria bambusicola]|uniref:thermolabile L-asparaginase n=1 Tax=Xylaria bambusicola TaxID=326684 RepID=UPI00200864AE|nr:thermolabile L-asparaginase [Xylaria bambusicola]KAI0508578.1 thermolabile L-asparaginase [Xylaria bambusicola]